ncbi:hypothetical protein KUA55_18190, partial [Enterococcus sp. ALS3]
MSRGWRKIEAGRTYRFTSITKVVSGAPGNQFRNGFSLYSEDASPVGFWFEFPTRPDPTGWITDRRDVTGDFLLANFPGSVYLRPVLHSGMLGDGTDLPGVTFAVSVLRSEDVTDSAAAGASAEAAATSASSASASET